MTDLPKASDAPPANTPPAETKPAETKPAETKPAETKPADEFKAYTPADIKLPDGMEKISDGLINEFIGLANESKFSPELKDKLVGLQVKAMQATRERDSQLWNDLTKTWKDELTADKELGGQNTEAALAEVSKLMQTYGGYTDATGKRQGVNELVQFFDTTAGGNNVHVIRFLHNIAKALNEGKPAQPGTPQPGTERTLAQRIHPNHGAAA